MGALSPPVGIAALAALLGSMQTAALHAPLLTAMPVVWSTLLKGRQIPPFFQEVAPSVQPALPQTTSRQQVRPCAVLPERFMLLVRIIAAALVHITGPFVSTPEIVLHAAGPACF